MIKNNGIVPTGLAPCQRPQSGIGLVEVLVALVVVSFGVLGMASLQLTGMKHSSGGFNRSKALLYAQSMASQMRVNEAGAKAGFYSNVDSAGMVCTNPPVPYCQTRPGVAATASCTLEELAVFDAFTVACGDVGTNGAEEGVVGTLPNGSLTVTCTAPCLPNSAHTITVSWTEGRSRTATDELITRRVQVKLKP